MTPEQEFNRLRWRCRRGMRELDMLLQGWMQQHWDSADAAQRAAFAELLDCQDTELWDWLSGRALPPRADWRVLIDDCRTAAAR